METLSPDVKTLLQSLSHDTNSDLYNKLIENTVLTKDDLLQFHALIHRAHNQFHDSITSISKHSIPQKKQKGVKSRV